MCQVRLQGDPGSDPGSGRPFPGGLASAGPRAGSGRGAGNREARPCLPPWGSAPSFPSHRAQPSPSACSGQGRSIWGRDGEFPWVSTQGLTRTGRSPHPRSFTTLLAVPCVLLLCFGFFDGDSRCKLCFLSRGCGTPPPRESENRDGGNKCLCPTPRTGWGGCGGDGKCVKGKVSPCAFLLQDSSGTHRTRSAPGKEASRGICGAL